MAEDQSSNKLLEDCRRYKERMLGNWRFAKEKTHYTTRHREWDAEDVEVGRGYQGITSQAD